MSDSNAGTRLAEEQARRVLQQAVAGVHLSPGSWQAVPRRRRRQRRRRVLAVAANLAIVLAMAGVVMPVVRERLAGGASTATPPAAPSSTTPPSPDQRLQQGGPTGPLHVVASGSYHGKAWQFIAYRAGESVCHGWNWAANPGYRPGGNPSANGQWPSVNGGASCGKPAPPLELSASAGTGRPVVVSGAVGKNVAEVRIFLRQRGSPGVVTVKPVGQELGLPVNFFVAVLAGTDGRELKAVVSKVVAYDRAGRPIAQVDA